MLPSRYPRWAYPVIRENKKWLEGVRQRLPEHYKRRMREFISTEQKPVHWRPNMQKYKVNPETETKKRLQNVPIRPVYPKEAHLGLWGGEGVVQGFIKLDKGSERLTRLWRPQLMKRLFYSEILDKHFAIVVTHRTMDQIDDVKGFDNYILKTQEADLKSQFGMDLKREMLLTLAQKDTALYPSDPAKRELIYNRYKEHIVPEEEAEWVGLPLAKAIEKQLKIEREEMLKSIQPWKVRFSAELKAQLEQMKKEGKPIEFVSQKEA